MVGRFANVQWDTRSVEIHSKVTEGFLLVEQALAALPEGRAKSLALTHLEESHMWVGKAVRDAQDARKHPQQS